MSTQQPTNSGFGRTTEPQEVLEGIDLSGKVAIVTGGYSGIGVETVRGLAGAGAKVIVPARNHAKAVGNLSDVAGDVAIMEMDLADLASVRAFADAFAKEHDRLDLLICNAGIMACPLTRVGPGWEQQFGVNHLGHFALAQALMPLLEKTAKEPDSDVRVVALSSTGHKLSNIRWDDPHWNDGEYDKWQAYGQAKTANALFAVGMNKRLAEQGARAFSVHPGGIHTPLQRHLDNEELVALGWMNEDGELSEQAARMFKTPTQGASTTLWAATSPALKERGGEYCEDCDVAELADPDNPSRYNKVQPYAVDEDAAKRLWAMSEEMVAGV
ncbi:MAG: oxidoreductase [Citromicrobium sp.]|nr:oxidoreductase [Citromicrobium sp.]